MSPNSFQEFLAEFVESYESNQFVKFIGSKPDKRENKSISKVAGRRVKIKAGEKISITYSHSSKEVVKNYDLDQSKKELEALKSSFQIFTLLTSDQRIELRRSKKGKESLIKVKEDHSQNVGTEHDRIKRKWIDPKAGFLYKLGICNVTGNVIPKMAGKWKQINKFIEIIESLIKDKSFNNPTRIVDMGSGSGYLTFALYEYLSATNEFQFEFEIVGIDQNKQLVDKCNELAKDLGCKNLKFINSSISDFEQEQIDILIALHACDTATDDAISKGIKSNAGLIVCAPCCHKQLRQDTAVQEIQDPIMDFGIYQERQFEMITDTIRSMIMEKAHYKTNIFEFVSNEHTRKNIMLIGSKSASGESQDKLDLKLNELKSKYAIKEHYLEKLMSNHDWNEV